MTGADGIALSPELPIGYLKNGAWVMYEYEVQEIQSPPDMGVRKRRFLSYLTGKKKR